MNISLLKHLNSLSDDQIEDILNELTIKDRTALELIKKYTQSTAQLSIPKHHEMKSIITLVTKKAREVIQTKEIEPYEFSLLRNQLISTIDLWLEPIFHNKRYDMLLILSGLLTTYNYDPFNDCFLFPGIDTEINLRIKRFLESLTSHERRDFFHTIFELIESKLYPIDLGGPAAFLSKVLGRLESSNLSYDLDLLKFYDEYFEVIKQSLILSEDLSYLPLFIHYLHLIKIYRNDQAYLEVIYQSRVLRDIVELNPYYKYCPEDWEKEHLIKVLSYQRYKQINSIDKDIRDTILNLDKYIQENDLNDHFIFTKYNN